MQATISRVVAVAGVSISSVVTRTGDGGVPRDPSLPAGTAGTLTTRTDDDTGVATLEAGHGLETADLVDVYWDGGMRYGMAATVDVNAVTVDSGAGDNLPVQDTVLVVTKQVPIDLDFAGDTMLVMGLGSDYRMHIDFLDSLDASLLAKEIAAGGCYTYDSETDGTNPLAGDDVASAVASCGNATYAAAMKLGILLDTT